MSLDIPTTAELRANIVAQIEASLGSSIPLLPKSVIAVLSATLAAVFVILFKYNGWIQQQIFVKYASFQESTVNGVAITPLIEFGVLSGIGEPTPATQAELVVDVNVTTQGGTVSAGTQFLKDSTGVVYLSTSAVTLDAATKSVTVRASSDGSGNGGRGVQGNLLVGDTMAFATVRTDCTPQVTVSSVAISGADKETEAVYRQRIINHFQARPQGGALADYREWGESAAGVLAVYPYTADTPGYVSVYVESATEIDGIPTGGQLSAVEDAIEFDVAGLATRRPASAFVSVEEITRTTVDVDVNGLDGLDSGIAELQADITTALTTWMLEREPYIAGLDIPPRKDTVSNAAVAGVVDDIVSGAGAYFTSVVVKISSAPYAVYSLGRGEKVKIGTVSFI